MTKKMAHLFKIRENIIKKFDARSPQKCEFCDDKCVHFRKQLENDSIESHMRCGCCCAL